MLFISLFQNIYFVILLLFLLQYFRKEYDHVSNPKHPKSNRRKKTGTQPGCIRPQGAYCRDRQSLIFPGPNRHYEPDQDQTLIPAGDLTASADPAVLHSHAHPLPGGCRADHHGKPARYPRFHAGLYVPYPFLPSGSI